MKIVHKTNSFYSTDYSSSESIIYLDVVDLTAKLLCD